MPLSVAVTNEVENITTSRKKETKSRRRRQRMKRRSHSLSAFNQMVPEAVQYSDSTASGTIASEVSEADTSIYRGIHCENVRIPPYLVLNEMHTCDTRLVFDSPTVPEGVCYGDEIRLWCYSTFQEKWSYLGYAKRSVQERSTKAVGKGDTFMLPPAPKSRVFHEAAFTLIGPLGEREDGEPLHYDDVVTLSDDRGMVWNNKSGRLHGRLGLSVYGRSRQMHMTFSRETQQTEEGVGYKRGGEGEVGKGKYFEDSSHFHVGYDKGEKNRAKGERVRYGDTFLIYAKKMRERGNKTGIVRSAVTHRIQKKDGHRGEYIRSDGKGVPLQFCVHRTQPRISAVSIYGQGPGGDETKTYYNVPWEQELEFNIPCGLSDVNILLPLSKSTKHDDAESMTSTSTHSKPSSCNCHSSNVICITMNNGGEVLLDVHDLKLAGVEDKYKWFNVTASSQDFRLKAHIQCLDTGTKQKVAIRTYLIPDLIASIVSIALKALILFSSSAYLRRMLQDVTLSWKVLWLSLEIASVYASILLASSLKGVMNKKKGTFNLTMVHGSSSHLVSFIKCENGRAEDAPQHDEEIESSIPPTFVASARGDFEKARRMWLNTLEWRRHVSADDALTTPHYKFDICKRYYPSAFHGMDKRGAVVYYEELGGIDIAGLKSRGVTHELLTWHCIWQQEYLWTIIAPTNDGRVSVVLDMKGIRMKDINGEVLAFTREVIAIFGGHYPMRSNSIVIVNVPWWFDTVWKIVKPLLSKETREKVSICGQSRVKNTLLKIIDEDQLPQEYGGSSIHELFQHPMELEMRQCVLKVITENGMRQISEINISNRRLNPKCDFPPLNIERGEQPLLD